MIRLKAVCKSRNSVHLGKFQMVRRTLFCRWCSFKRWVSAANSQAGQAWIITDLISALWRTSLMLALKRWFLNKGVDSNKCSEGLGFNHFYVQSPCNPLIEDYIQIFYMIDEWDIPSVQCKMIVSGHKPMRKVDVLSFILIDFYVLALTSRLNSIETLLQLSETEHQFTNSFLL
jgi:hypothetical protein